MRAYFVSQLLNISGKYLKKNITPKELSKPLLDAMRSEKKQPRRDRKEDEEYLRRVFNLPEGVKEDGN